MRLNLNGYCEGCNKLETAVFTNNQDKLQEYMKIGLDVDKHIMQKPYCDPNRYLEELITRVDEHDMGYSENELEFMIECFEEELS